mmetsp:Transcript_37762/g.108994  ORF Transcript_37762/g.108994 Transcript_37762/m.108994 type:complete len:656 (+) Transcript_37762:563-2530(+)
MPKLSRPLPMLGRAPLPTTVLGVRSSLSTVLTSVPLNKSRSSVKRTRSPPGGYSRSAACNNWTTEGSSRGCCLRNSACVCCKSSLFAYFRKKSIDSTWDRRPLRSFGAVFSSSTNANALDRKTWLSLSRRSTSRKQMSKSEKSKAPSCGQPITFRMMRSCTALECAMARFCQTKSTSQALSNAFGSLLLKSIFVSCASFSALNKRWHCCVNVTRLPGNASTSFKMSFQVWSTARHVNNLSLASLTTASTTPLHSPKRSGKTSDRHFHNSSSKRARSPNSMAVCNGGSSRSTTLICSVTSRSVRSCSSVCFRTSSKRFSAAADSWATCFSHWARKSAVRRFISRSSAAILRSHSVLNKSICPIISVFSSAKRLRSASNSADFLAMAASLSAIFLLQSAKKSADFFSMATFSSDIFLSKSSRICACSFASFRSKSARKAAVRCFISISSACILRLLSSLNCSISRIISAFSAASLSRSARNSWVRFFKASFSSDFKLHSSDSFTACSSIFVFSSSICTRSLAKFSDAAACSSASRLHSAWKISSLWRRSSRSRFSASSCSLATCASASARISSMVRLISSSLACICCSHSALNASASACITSFSRLTRSYSARASSIFLATSAFSSSSLWQSAAKADMRLAISCFSSAISRSQNSRK